MRLDDYILHKRAMFWGKKGTTSVWSVCRPWLTSHDKMEVVVYDEIDEWLYRSPQNTQNDGLGSIGVREFQKTSAGEGMGWIR